MPSLWQEKFPGCEPVGYRLRAAFPDRWVRFHSLPGSKRYPGTGAEYAELLSRHNRVLGELSEGIREVILLTTGYSDTPDPVRASPELQQLDPAARPWRTVPMHQYTDEFGDPSFWHVFASRWDWRPGRFDPLVRLVADDVVANVLVVDPDCRWVLHPYDGGMDVIADSPAARNRLKAAHPAWLSARQDGL